MVCGGCGGRGWWERWGEVKRGGVWGGEGGEESGGVGGWGEVRRGGVWGRGG